MRFLARAFLYSVLLNLLYYVVLPVLSGLLQTWTYVPDITAAYTETEYLQREVAFGVINEPNLWGTVPLSLLLGMGISIAFIYLGRCLKSRFVHRR